MMRNYDTLNRSLVHPQDILRWAIENFGERLALVTSFQPTGIVTMHMLYEMGCSVDVVTLDTGLLFPETYALMDRLQAIMSFNLVRVTPELTVEQQAAQYGEALWSRKPDACCHMRKVMPLDKALVGYDAWIAGLRRDQSAGRSTLEAIGWDQRNDKVKISPFIEWTEDMIWTYIRAYDLPYNPLHDQNYPSIGCYPCTKAVAPGEDMRAGRWAGKSKTECGIHLEAMPEKP